MAGRTICASCLSFAVYAKSAPFRAQEQGLHLDIPTKLKKANVGVDMGFLFFNGDAPFALVASVLP